MALFGLILAAAIGTAGGAIRVDVRPGESLTAVRDRVREMSAAARARGVEIVLAPGEYVLPAVLELDGRDASVTWRSAEGPDRTWLVAGFTLPRSAFAPVGDDATRARFDADVRGRVLEADLSALRIDWPPSWYFGAEREPPLPVVDVFVDGERMKLATFPATGWAEMAELTDVGTVTWGVAEKDLADVRGGEFRYREERPSRWAAHPDVAIEAFWCYDWRGTIIRAKAIDPAKKTIRLAAPHTFGLKQGNPSPRRWRAVNVLEEVNRPGTYAVDFARRRLYLLPPRSDFASVGLCGVSEPIVRARDVKGLRFEGIGFGRSAACGLRLERCEDVTVERCWFRDQRTWAAIGTDCLSCVFRTCDVTATGQGCFELGGGDRKTLSPGNNVVEDCLFYEWGALVSKSASAIRMTGVANVARHNEIRDASGQIAWWYHVNDCVFEYNVVSNCLWGTDDAGAFYKGRDPSARGNVLRYNYWRDIGADRGHGSSAIYFDDGDGGDRVYGNVFCRAGHPGKGPFGTVFSHSGYSNHVENCIFVDCERALGSVDWGQAEWTKFLAKDEPAYPLKRNMLVNVDITKPPFTTRYPELVGYLGPHPDHRRWNGATRNLFVNCETVASGRWHTNATDVAVGGDFDLKAGVLTAPAVDGFEPIPFDRIGLLTRRSAVMKGNGITGLGRVGKGVK